MERLDILLKRIDALVMKEIGISFIPRLIFLILLVLKQENYWNILNGVMIITI